MSRNHEKSQKTQKSKKSHKNYKNFKRNHKKWHSLEKVPCIFVRSDFPLEVSFGSGKSLERLSYLLLFQLTITFITPGILWGYCTTTGYSSSLVIIYAVRRHPVSVARYLWSIKWIFLVYWRFAWIIYVCSHEEHAIVFET